MITRQKFHSKSNTLRGVIEFFPDNSAKIKLRFQHPMDSGLTHNKPRQFIERVDCLLNDKAIFSAHFYAGISTNPPLFFKVERLVSHDSILINWQDGNHHSESIKIVIKK